MSSQSSRKFPLKLPKTRLMALPPSMLLCLVWYLQIVLSLSLNPSIILSSTFTRINGDHYGAVSNINEESNTEMSMMDQSDLSDEEEQQRRDPLSSTQKSLLSELAPSSPLSLLRLSLLRSSENPLEMWPGMAGAAALQQVQFLASKATDSTSAIDESQYSLAMRQRNRMQQTDQTKRNPSYQKMKNLQRQIKKWGSKVDAVGQGGGVFNNEKYNFVAREKLDSQTSPAVRPEATKREEQVWTALANLELDMQLLDKLAGQNPQLSAFELFMMSATVAAAASGPWVLGGQLTEFLAPAAAAFSAAIGLGAEYVGRVAVADGKEVAAAAIGCASEAEGLLANAERAKAVTPLCVGIGATATTLSLLVPVLLGTAEVSILNEVYLVCPLISVLAAAVCGLALQDTKVFVTRAMSVGNRRFARSGSVGRTWLSAGEQIVEKSTSNRKKWRSFCFGVLPAPILGSLVPAATLATKSIIVAALAAAQSAYFLAECEYCVARATDAVAIKARSAAVCDTYANQGARSAAILPFTSALSGLCAAATAAIVELPFLETLSSAGTFQSLATQMAVVAFFPAFSTLFAAAASVSKARCEVQSEAAVQAASTLALEYNKEDEDDPILRPFWGVYELIRLTYSSSIKEPYQRLWRRIKVTMAFGVNRFKFILRRLSSGKDNISRNQDAEALAYMDC